MEFGPDLEKEQQYQQTIHMLKYASDHLAPDKGGSTSNVAVGYDIIEFLNVHPRFKSQLYLNLYLNLQKKCLKPTQKISLGVMKP